MKRAWNHQAFVTSVGIMAMVVQQGLWEGPRARGQEPVVWCDTHEAWVAGAGNHRAVAQRTCPTMGTCDTPSVRDPWTPGPSTPVVTLRMQFHVFCETDGSNCAASPSGIAAQMTQLNSDYAPHRIQFTESSAVVYHNNSTYRALAFSEVDPMKDTYADDPAHQINVYVADLPGLLNGRGTFPWTVPPLDSISNRT